MRVRDQSGQQVSTASDSPIVVFGFPGLGDLVRCHSLIRMIAAREPTRPIDLVARRGTVEIGAFMPEIREVIGEDFRHNSLNVFARLHLAATLRKRRYRTAYLIQSSFKSALAPFLAQIPERIGWSDEGRLLLLTRPQFRMRRLPRMVDRICWLGLDREQKKLPDLSWPEPRFAVPAALRARFEEIKATRGTAPVVALAPGSAHTYKNWPIENFAAIARRCAELGATVWIVGASAQRELAEAVRKEAPLARDCLTESLSTLALTIAAADIFVGNDSGPLHVAAAFGKRCVAIFGHTDIEAKAPINPAVDIVMPERTVAQTSRTDVHWPSLDAVMPAVERVLAERI